MLSMILVQKICSVKRMLIVTELVLRETQCIRSLYMKTEHVHGSLELKNIFPYGNDCNNKLKFYFQSQK